MVTLQYALNFRETPGGRIMRVLPAFVTLTAVERVPGWILVDWYGQKGWVSADYVDDAGRLRVGQPPGPSSSWGEGRALRSSA